MPEVTIIVPFYNSELFLERCIESILKQSFHDFELILVDDGSTDNGKVYADNYARKDLRVKVIHQKNQGVSAARNAGIRCAVGRYIMFCDSDDYVDYQWCEQLVKLARRYPDSLCVCKMKNEKHNYNMKVQKVNYFELYKMGISAYCWNKIYFLEKIRNKQCFFDETITISEDVKFNVNYIKNCCKDIRVLDMPLYYYKQNEYSTMKKYYEDFFEKNLLPFRMRVPLIQEDQMQEYCDIWLYRFIKLFDNVFDKRNKMLFIQKMHYNQKMLKTKEFELCLKYATGKNENPLVMKILKKKNYYCFWLFQKLVSIKNREG